MSAPALEIRKITLKNVRGIGHLVFEPNQTGVTVLYGDNETGKSTVIEAFLLLLTKKVLKTSDKEVKSFISNKFEGAPFVEAELCIGDYELKYSRTYSLGAGKASLKLINPNERELKDDEAINRFHEILDAHSKPGLREAMTVKQGEALDVNALFSNPSIHDALGADGAGDSSDSAGAGGGLQRVLDPESAEFENLLDKERDKYFTKTGQYKGSVKALETVKNEKNIAVEAARNKLAEADSHAEDIRKREENINRYLLKQAEAEAKVLEMEPEVKELADSREKYAAQAKSVESAQAEHERAEKQLQKRADLESELKKLQDKVAEAEAEKTASLEAEAAYKDNDASKQLADLLTLELDLADKHRDYIQQRQSLKNAQESVQQLAETLRKHADLQKQYDGLAKPNGTAPDKAKLERIGDLADDLINVASKRDKVAVNIQVTGPDGNVIKENSADKTLAGGKYATSITDKTNYELGEYAIEISPQNDAVAVTKAFEASRTAFVSAVKKYQADIAEQPLDTNKEIRAVLKTLTQAHEAHEKYRDDKANLAAQMQSVLGGEAAESLKEKQEAAQAEVTETEEKLASARDSVKEVHEQMSKKNPEKLGRNIPALEALLAETATADEKWVQNILKLSDKKKTDSAKQQDAIQKRITDASSNHAKAETSYKLRSEDLKKMESLEVLQEKVKQAGAELRVEQEKLEQIPTVDADLLEAKSDELDGYKSAAQMYKDNVQTEKEAIARSRALLDSSGGCADALSKAENDAYYAQQEYADVMHRAAAVKCLSDTYYNAKRQMLAESQRPFRNDFTKLANALLDEPVEFDFDENLAIQTRTIGGKTVDVDQLSGGMTEQISLIYRLAAVGLMSRGASVPIFFDDTLGFSDPDRTGKMNSLLKGAGEKRQIIVTTCDLSRFDKISGSKVIGIADIKQQS